MDARPSIGLALIIAGLLLIILAVVFSLFPILSNTGVTGSVSVGGCIVVLFIPVCFGAGEHGDILLLASALIGLAMVLALLWIIVWGRRDATSSP